MSVVYLAEDTRLKRRVAIKFLLRHIAGNCDEQKRFEIEVKAAAVLDYPNIVTIHAIEHNDDLFNSRFQIPKGSDSLETFKQHET